MRRIALGLLLVAGFTALATTAHAQNPVTPGAFCSPEGATGTTADGTTVFCTRTAGEDQPRWRAATTQQTQPPVATTAPGTVDTAPSTVTTAAGAMPRTGRSSGTEAALGFAAVLLGVLAVWWGRPRLAAFFSGPRLIEEERIDRAAKLLGWSDAWQDHLNKPHWLRHDRDE
jgi:hypothetical protein